MSPISTNPTIQSAFKLLCQTQDPKSEAEGFRLLKAMAESGDMTAAAMVGWACQLPYHSCYNLEMAREYLDISASASNSKGQYYKGSLLISGSATYEKDVIMGKWLLEQAAAKGEKAAIRLLDVRYRERGPEEIEMMYKRALLRIVLSKVLRKFEDYNR